MGSHGHNHSHEQDKPSPPPPPPLPPSSPSNSSFGIINRNNNTATSPISTELSSPAVPASSSTITLGMKQHNENHAIVHHHQQHDDNGRLKGEGKSRGWSAAAKGAAHQRGPASPRAEDSGRCSGFSEDSGAPKAGPKAAAAAAVASSPSASVLRSPAAAAQVQRLQQELRRRRLSKSRRRHAPAPVTAPQLPGAEPMQARPTQPQHAMAILPSAHKAARATAAALKASSKFNHQRERQRHSKSLASAPARASKATATADALSQPTVRSEIQRHESHQLANKPFQSSIKHHHNQHLLRSLSTNSGKLSPASTYNNNNFNSIASQPKTALNNRMADQAVIDKLEAGFAKLQATTPEQCHSLLKKYLTREVLDQLKSRKTAMGATLLDVVQSGFENLDSGVGVYAPDAESYTLFAELFNPIIEDYHGGFKATDKHPASDFGDIESLVNVDPDNQYVISTRVRCGRSLKGYPFNPCLTEAQYKEMEDKVSGQFKEMDGDLAGTYYPLTGMTKEVQQQLIDDHFLFKEGDRFLQAANACRYWPTGRGIYHNKEKTFLVWVNEEDHLRIISMQKGGDLKTIFGRLVRGAKAIEAKVPFSRDERLGFLTFCPTNLGTTIRASVHIKLPKLAADRKKLEEVAGKFNLQVRGTSGEHTESVGGVYDISNKRRLGLTEYQAVREMQDGILELIKIEKSL